MYCRGWLWSIACCAGLVAGSVNAGQPANPEKIPRLIAQLGDSDVALRQQAERELLQLGLSARDALRAAAQGNAPEIRRRAARLLREMTYALPSDPPVVRQLLEKYSSRGVESRCATVRELGRLQGIRIDDPLLRVILDDSSSEVGWEIVGVLRGRAIDPKLPPVHDLEQAENNAPALALAGWIWRRADPPRAEGLFRRSLDAATGAHSTQIDDVFAALIDISIADRNYNGAADLLRRQYLRDPETRETLRETFNRLDDLFALHAQVGPLTGFLDDLKQHRDQLTRPQILYCLSHMARRHPVGAFVLRQLAYAAGGFSQQRRAQAAEFLVNHGWNEDAQRELDTVILLDDAPTNAVALNAHFRLGMLAARRGDHALAAREQRLSLERMAKLPVILTISRGDRTMSGDEATRIVWAEVLWHELLDARARRDEAAELDRALQLAERAPVPEEIVLDAVPLLKARGRAQEAQKLFEPAYKQAKAALHAAPDDPHRMNGVAWLCARCDEHLEEAVALADRAVKLQPDAAALLDTAAEAHFRVGHVEEAVRLETRALQLQPDDQFMRGQLERFKKGR